MRQFVSARFISELVEQFSFRRRKVKHILLIGVVVFSLLALARPQWGFEWREIKREGLDILFVIDTSKSMLTQDVKPNRLERTKFAVKDVIKKLKGDRVGLLAFSGDAFMMCPLTNDYGGFLLTLNELNVNVVPRGGTDLERAIEVALEGYGDVLSKHKAIVIITDGDNLEGSPLAQAKLAKQKGIKIYTIGVGTAEGELIKISDAGSTNYLKDAQGNVIKSRLNESLLKDIALETEGIYIRSSGFDFGLDVLYEKELSKLEKRQIESKMERQFYDRFQFPLALALLLLIGETCILTRRNA
ncbi:MAG: Ca-activated chloride channel family protein [Lysobacterales bacterium]|jgi:Ca-activated chloride channel family protein